MVDRIYSFYNIENFNILPKGHGVIFGKTGAGKTSLLLKIAKLLSEKKRTTIILDPHGDISKNILDNNSIYLSPAFKEIDSKKFSIKMNIMEYGENITEEKINTITESLKMLFSMDMDYSQGTWGPRLETIFSSIIPYALRNFKNVTINDIIDILLNRNFNDDLLFFKKFSYVSYLDYIQSTLNKILPIKENVFLKEFIGSKNITFSFLRNNIEGKIVSINLAKNELGEFTSRMAGSAILAMILNAVKFGKLKNFTLIIDEIKDFSPYLLPNLYSESRKYNMDIIIAAQYIGQLGKDLFDSIMGNVSWIVSFKISPDDSVKISKKFSYETNKIERLLTDLPEHYFLFKETETKVYYINKIQTINNEEFIEKSYINFGSEIDMEFNDLLGIIYSIMERFESVTYERILKEYKLFFKKDFLSLDPVLRILKLNNLIEEKGGIYTVTEKGLEYLSENNSINYETLYHRYLVSRTAEFFRAFGFDVELSSQWKNMPDLIIKKDNIEYFVEAEFMDLKSPGKVLTHLISWKNRKLIFVTFKKFAMKLFKILCEPAIIKNDGTIIYYKNNKNSVDYHLAGDYSKNVWIFIVPEPGELGMLKKFTFNKIEDIDIFNLNESDLFTINGQNIFDIFNNELLISRDGKLTRRCDFFKI